MKIKKLKLKVGTRNYVSYTNNQNNENITKTVKTNKLFL